MRRTSSRLLAGVFMCAPLVAGMQTASAVPAPGGTLDPTTIPKYVTDLVIPPVLYDDKGAPMHVEVAQRQIKQQVLPDGFPKTPLWAYGDPKRPKTFNNPAFTFEVTKGTETKVKWKNELVLNPHKCFYKKNVPWWQKKLACLYRPHIIRDKFNRPIVDQTLHWAAPNEDCVDGIPRTDCRGASDRPYWGPVPMVVHVHGAFVGPGSDGYPEAWWLPNASNIDCNGDTRIKFDDFACEGTFFESAEGADTANARGKGYAIDIYGNNQPTTTLWYHDHTLGITRLNVYAASAGFWLIRDHDDGETGLVSGILPGPAPTKGQDPNCSGAGKKGTFGNCARKQIREIPIAIQPKSFNRNGRQFYPADRAFFEELSDGQVFNKNAKFDDNFPFLPQTISDIAPAWNPEAFFNTMVVNGKTWPTLDVAPERYRFRLLNAADGRWLNLALHVYEGPGPDGKVGTGDDVLGDEIPFYQIGAEQGLLPQVVRIETNFATPLPGGGKDVCPPGTTTDCVPAVPGTKPDQALLMGPAERADVIVDFSALADGTVVRMTNTGPDSPFGGDFGADLDTSYQVMQFVVDKNMPAGAYSTHPADLVLDPNPGGVPKFTEEELTGTVVRDLALIEEESAKVCFEQDMTTGVITYTGVPDELTGCAVGDPFGPQAAVLGVNGSGGGGTATLWDEAIVTNPQLGDIEIWELYNNSADAHPIHLHLVKFQVINRDLVVGGAERPPEPWEMGWKDTVTAYPEEVVRVAAKFEIPGLYVWHCHLLSHEDNEMMVPFCVGDPDQDCMGAMF